MDVDSETIIIINASATFVVMSCAMFLIKIKEGYKKKK